MKKLTLKQKIFADEYIITRNATESALKAGYSKRTAHSIGNENLKKPEIKSYISERLAELDKETIARQDEVLQYFTSVMRGEHTEQVLISRGEIGQGITSIEVSAKDRIRAAIELNKVHMAGTPSESKVKVTIVNDIPKELE